MQPWQPLLTNPSPLVFTDLDGTLLDHDDYSHKAAAPALSALEQHKVPVIPVTSKTCAELVQLRKVLDNHHPFIVENGAAIYIPVGYFREGILDTVLGNSDNGELSISKIDARFYVYTLGYNREYWINCLKNLDTALQSAFTGFNELGTAGIAKYTDLPMEREKLANQREASEPLLWRGTDTELANLATSVALEKGQILRGGRFVHVLDHRAGKGQALKRLCDCYREQLAGSSLLTAALGDAENDVSMLEVVDCPMVIRSKHREPPDTRHIANISTSEKIGPAGWNEKMSAFIGTITNRQT